MNCILIPFVSKFSTCSVPRLDTSIHGVQCCIWTRIWGLDSRAGFCLSEVSSDVLPHDNLMGIVYFLSRVLECAASMDEPGEEG